MKNEYKNEWLPHLKDSISSDAGIPGISLYTIALEGWRRKLKLKFYSESEEKKRLKYILSNGEKEFHFDDSSGNLNTDQAVEICNDKGVTEEYLHKANIPVPRGRVFNQKSSKAKIKEYVKSLTYPLVVKPVDGLGGKGVIVDIKNEKELFKAIRYVQDTLSFKEIIIQEFIKGEEVRIYVLDDEIIGAAMRIPANVIGDGTKTIKKLIDEKNELRKTIPHLKYRPIKIDAELRELVELEGYTLDSILGNGERLYLRRISNVSIGGEPVDYTNQLTDNQRKIAIEATKAVPGLKQCGVDMMVNKENGKGVIIELNASPGIGSHIFPIEGKARDIPKAIIDYYFPETKDTDIISSKFYYNLGKTSDGILNGTLSEVELPIYPSDKTYVNRYVFTSELQMDDIYSKLDKHILKKKLNGFIKHLDRNKYELVVGHQVKDEIEQFYKVLERIEADEAIENIKTYNWDKPLKHGFGKIDGLNSISNFELENKHKHAVREIRALEKEVKRLRKRIKLMKSSRAWKMTRPIRQAMKIVTKTK